MKKVYEFLEIILFETGEYKFTIARLVLILAILLGSHLTYLLIRKILMRRLRKSRHHTDDEGKVYALRRLIAYFLYSIAVIIAMESAGVDVTLLVAGSTALLVGIGFGLQNTFNDLVSGILLLFEGTVQVNDTIKVGELVGVIKSIGLRASQLKTEDDRLIIVPNSKLISENVVNWKNREQGTRFSVDVKVAYGEDVDLVVKILEDCAIQEKEVESQPDPFVMLSDFSDSGIEFKLFYFSKNKLFHEKVKSSLRFCIERAFREKGIKIPFPQRDLHHFYPGKSGEENEVE